MRVIVCGSRGWKDRDQIAHILSSLPGDTTIVHGAARGADRLAGDVAERDCGFKVEQYPADWGKNPRRAGHIRNDVMLDTDPDLVIAFWDGISRGTGSMIDKARKRGILVEVYTPEGAEQYRP